MLDRTRKTYYSSAIWAGVAFGFAAGVCCPVDAIAARGLVAPAMEARGTGRWEKKQGENAALAVTGNGGCGAGGDLCVGLVTAALKRA